MSAMTLGPKPPTGSGVMHAGGGAGLFLIQLSAIVPGLLPTVALLAAFLAVLAVPLLALGLVVAVVAAPPYLIWRTARGALHRG
jgi:hypothetical protein